MKHLLWFFILKCLCLRSLEAQNSCLQCETLEISSNSETVHRKHGEVLGSYKKLMEVTSNGSPIYKHEETGKFYLYYSNKSKGYWAVSEVIGSDVVRLENQGDSLCPIFLKSLWRYADGDVNALIYDVSLRVVCLTEPCSLANCGFQATCSRNNKTCSCLRGYIGNPYERCYPAISECECRRLLFTSNNSAALSKQEDSFGEYFLYGEYEGHSVYQHFAGVEYLYHKDGNWLLSDKIGVREAGLQNQGEVDPKIQRSVCPYHLRTSWEYADVEAQGWQWIYDHSAHLLCPSDPCSLTRCGFHAKCTYNIPGQTSALCTCLPGYEGDPNSRCFPTLSSTVNCSCKTLELSSKGSSAYAQSDKMGLFYLYGEHGGVNAYQHESGLDYLYFADGKSWVIGASLGGSRVGIVNFAKESCPYSESLNNKWYHSHEGQLRQDDYLTLTCKENNVTMGPSLFSHLPVVKTPVVRKQKDKYPCNCEEIWINSTNSDTLKKHYQQLGLYKLLQNGEHPIYEQVSDSETTHYLYYHESYGGNWLINTRVGLPYGGIQNSKDSPSCPYHLNTMWQFGDSDLGGWIYDSSLRVVCPTDECSKLKCGFRASCVPSGEHFKCECHVGFTGNPYERCFPKKIPPPCRCRHLRLSSSGPSQGEQRDKIGDYYLWGYYNSGRPVYQHVSGLDFIYYHTSSVWGVGPKVGGNSAGLLNFGAQMCPYELSTYWEYGVRKSERQIDESLRLECVERQRFGPKPSPQSCGLRRQMESSPWHVQILSKSGSILHHVCSGVIISPVHILTSASCMLEHPLKSYQITVGRSPKGIDSEFKADYYLQNAFLHDNYNSNSEDFNIALLKTKGVMSFNSFVSAICLPTYSYPSNISHCESISVSNESEYVGNSLMCSDESSSVYTCKSVGSMSGGGIPLICYEKPDNPGMSLLGISHIPSGTSNMSIAFQKVDAYRDWIVFRLAL